MTTVTPGLVPSRYHGIGRGAQKIDGGNYVQDDDLSPSNDEETIEASAWQMWVMVYRTCGLWVALRTAVKYGWMVAKGEV